MLAARKRKITLPAKIGIDAEVDLNLGDSGYFLGTRLNVTILGLERSVAKGLVDEAENICPFSRATRGNMEAAKSTVVGLERHNSPALQHWHGVRRSTRSGKNAAASPKRRVGGGRRRIAAQIGSRTALVRCFEAYSRACSLREHEDDM